MLYPWSTSICPKGRHNCRNSAMSLTLICEQIPKMREQCKTQRIFFSGMGSGSSKGLSGFRICKIAPGSPASSVSLEVFFDYIIQVGDTMVESREQSFADLVKVGFSKCISNVCRILKRSRLNSPFTIAERSPREVCFCSFFC